MGFWGSSSQSHQNRLVFDLIAYCCKVGRLYSKYNILSKSKQDPNYSYEHYLHSETPQCKGDSIERNTVREGYNVGQVIFGGVRKEMRWHDAFKAPKISS